MGWTKVRGFGALRRSLVTAGLVVAVVGGFAHAASAWHPVLSGDTTCSDSDHVVTWSIGNSNRHAPMTIASATASVGSTQYAVSGYSAVVPGGGSTPATTTVPGAVTGTVVLTVHATWPAGQQATASTSVVLEENCTTTTTTSTSTTTTMTTTTTIPRSTTVVTEGTSEVASTTIKPSVVTIAGVTSTTAAANRLPVTGSGGRWPPLLGVCVLGSGCVLSFVSRRRHGASTLR